MCIGEIMQKDVVSVKDDATIEEAALIMTREKIGGMPVLSAVGKLVGIISSTDIFRAFIAVMGLDSGKTRLTIDVSDRKGVLRDISTVLADLDISIDSMVTLPQPNGTYQIIIRADIDAWLRRLETERGYSAHTLDAYRRDLVQLARWLAPATRGVALAEASEADLLAYLADAHGHGKPSSANRRLTVIKRFYQKSSQTLSN